MEVAPDDFAAWMAQADIPASHLGAEQDALLRAVFRFRKQQGADYYSTRLLSHFLLHAGTGLKVAQIARLLGISRPNASKQQGLSSKEAIRQAHHRMHGRPYGKLLPRYVGPVAAFLLGHPDATRRQLLDFIEQTFKVKVSRVALYKFLRKYGLQHQAEQAGRVAEAEHGGDASTAGQRELPAAAPPTPRGTAPSPVAPPAPLIESAAAGQAKSPQAPPFCSDGRNTPGPSC
jgi:transposase